MIHPTDTLTSVAQLGAALPKAQRAVSMLRNALHEAPRPPGVLLSQVEALHHALHVQVPPLGLRIATSTEERS